MIKRVSVLASCVKVQDGPVLHTRPRSKSKYLVPNAPQHEKYKYILSTETMVPKEHFSFMAAGLVSIDTLTQDENGEFYNLNQSIVTDKLISITVRQFLVAPLHNLAKEINTKGFCLIDLTY